MKPRFYAFIGIIILVVIIAGIALASSISNTPKPGKIQLIIVTVQAQVGVEYIKIENMNTGTSIYKTGSEIAYKPFSFNVTKGDQLRLTVYTLDDYVFNSWTFSNFQPEIGMFDQHNPLIFYATIDNTLKAGTLIIPATETPATPTPSPTNSSAT